MKTKLYTALFLLGFGAAADASAQCSVTFTYTSNGLTISANAVGTGMASIPTYGWDWGDTQIGIGQSQAHTYTTGGTYNVCAYYFDLADTASCNATSCQMITVSAVGVNEVKTPEVSIGTSPNPFTSKTNISVSNNVASEVSLQVFDMVGKQVSTIFNDNLSAGTHILEWNAPELPSGVYFVQVKAGELMKTIRVVKQ